jgi:hypothetical protein
VVAPCFLLWLQSDDKSRVLQPCDPKNAPKLVEPKKQPSDQRSNGQ